MRVRFLSYIGMGALVLSVVSSSYASTSCEQALRLLGVTGARARGHCVFWVAEDVNGECCESRLVQVVIQGDKAQAIKTSLKTYQGWGSLAQAVSLLEGPKGMSLEKHGTTWQDTSGRITLVAPGPNKALHKRYLEAARTWCSSAEAWNKHMGAEGTLYPAVRGMETTLVYAYARGYYVNYRIKRALYLPGRSLVFVQTEQTERAVGNDTMHGFLILRVLPKQDLQ